MSDSKDDADKRDRPNRNDRAGDRPQRSGRDASAGRNGDRSQKRPYSGGGEKRPYGDRDAKRPYSGGDKRPYGDRDAKRPHGDRDAKRPYSGGGEKRPYGDRDAKRPYSGGDKRPYSGGGEKRPYGDRDAKRPYSAGGEKRPYGDRDAKRPYGNRDAKRPHSGGGEKRPYSDTRRSGHGARPDERAAQREAPRETFGAANLAVRPRHDDPEIPERIEPRDLDKGARAELKTLSKDNADAVARHLVAASELLEDDPELAHRHAQSAARRAGRVAVVRETLAITAYATGDFALALRELRTYRRISGSNDQLPLMVDSERGVGRPDRALEVGRAVDRAELPAAVQVGLAIAMSGARLDLNQPELALAELEIPQLDPDRAFSYSPALFSAYAEVLEGLGRTADAAVWRSRAERAEAALGGPAEAELIEIFEIEIEADESDAESDGAESEVDESHGDEIEADESDGAEHEGAEDAPDATDDPGAVLEDDVAAVLAEGERLQAHGAAASDDETNGGTPGGPVPHED
ncbi:MAG TPA: hypothetical protein VFG92_07795 [Agromyces sp.]|nr:hypothetical protein [Agromyces sp.]